MVQLNKYVKLANAFITTTTFTTNNSGNNNNNYKLNIKLSTYAAMQNFQS